MENRVKDSADEGKYDSWEKIRRIFFSEVSAPILTFRFSTIFMRINAGCLTLFCCLSGNS